MSSERAEPRRALAEQLRIGKVLRDTAWQTAVEAVPREEFLGEAVYQFTAGADLFPWRVLRRTDVSADEWLALAYADTTWVTQIDGVDAADATGPMTGEPTSSSSLPSLVVGMLEDLDVADGHTVLEVATGTGYSTALLCHRLSDANVTSVEVDESVAARAKAALARLGYEPRLLVADGFGGGGGGRDYDRIVATCAFRYVPPPWLYQVDTGSKILLTLSGWMGANAQVLLMVDDDGVAQGRFLPGHRSFMLARSQQPPPRGPLFFPPGAPERDTPVGADVLTDWTGRFVAQLAAPAAWAYGTDVEQGLWDVATGSHARVYAGKTGWRVAQHGPVRLWDAVEDAVAAWRGAGAPHIAAFGMTATPDEQRVWLAEPDGPSWRLPV